MSEAVDLFVIGGGINGAAVARDAAGRGLSVCLAEKDDYASGTSSASSKLVHGGLRYLEQWEFRLVRESLREREVLMRNVPHLVRPLRFLLPITREQSRPAWLVGMGLWLYRLLSGAGTLGAPGRLSPAEANALPCLRKEGLRAVMHYPDCWVDDARLVLETLLDARARGADIGNRREVIAVDPGEDGFEVGLRERGFRRTVHARYVVNAGGPWANRVLDLLRDAAPRRSLKLIRGSHIVVATLEPGRGDAYTLQNEDGRVVFVLPWLERYLIVGTTEVVHDGDPEAVACSEEERDYLLRCYNHYFEHPVEAADVLWSYAGLRALVDDGTDEPSKITRDYEIQVYRRGNGALITVYGGKLTTHRRLGERVMTELRRLGARVGAGWTENAPVHGGALEREALLKLAAAGPDDLPPEIWRRWTLTYGSSTPEIYDRIAAHRGLARMPAPDVPEAELIHAAEVEDARTAEDFLYRRTKLFMALDAAGREAVANWFERRNR